MMLKELVDMLNRAYEKGAQDGAEVCVKNVGDEHLSPLIGVTLDIQHDLAAPIETGSVIKLWIDKQEDYEA